MSSTPGISLILKTTDGFQSVLTFPLTNSKIKQDVPSDTSEVIVMFGENVLGSIPLLPGTNIRYEGAGGTKRHTVNTPFDTQKDGVTANKAVSRYIQTTPGSYKLTSISIEFSLKNFMGILACELVDAINRARLDDPPVYIEEKYAKQTLEIVKERYDKKCKELEPYKRELDDASEKYKRVALNADNVRTEIAKAQSDIAVLCKPS